MNYLLICYGLTVSYIWFFLVICVMPYLADCLFQGHLLCHMWKDDGVAVTLIVLVCRRQLAISAACMKVH